MTKHKILGIIPARGGSKGIPRKNIKLLGGKPLLAWTIQAAFASNSLDRLILSTEDKEIAAVGSKLGCEVPFLRPMELAQDETPGIEPVLYSLNWLKENENYEPDFVMLLQPTSPFRGHEQIKEAVDIVHSSEFEEFDSLVSVVEPKHPPQWMFSKEENNKLIPLSTEIASRRQDISTAYALNGAIYITRTSVIYEEKTFIPRRTMGYVMDRVSSIDLDDMLDWKIAEMCFYTKNIY